MKKFFDGGEYFVLTSYRIKTVPIAEDNEVGLTLAKTICEDACYLSSAGNGQTAIEILRIAGRKAGSRIHHLLTLRTHDSSEHDCVVRQEALEKGILSLLHQSGFTAEEVSFEKYRKHISEMDTDSVWALMKQDIQEYGVQETYKSPSVVESVDWKRIYSVLDGSGCGLCIQIIPALLSDDERRLIAKNTAHCSQAVDGVVPNMRDSLAAASADRWKYYAQKVANPFAEVNLIVIGTVTSAALVTARIKQSVHGTAFRPIAVSAYQKYSIYNQPWKISHDLKKSDAARLCKWTSDEISQIFQLPMQGSYFIGIDRNAFSLMPEVDLLPDQLTNDDREGLYLGRSVYSSQRLFVPLEQLLLHTAVMGKSGVGKTTLLKQLIKQFQSRSIPVLILEPVKREYRDLVAGMKNSRVFTVERPVVPLLINPFYVPKDVPLGEYRSSLLSAFKAAFSLPDPLPALFEKAISEAYTLNGWTDIRFLCVPHPLCLKLRREQPRSLLFFWRFFVIFRIDGCKQKQTMSSCGDLLDVSVFRDNKIERMRTMKNYEGIMSIGNMELKDLVIEESPNSLIVTAKKKIYVPEKKIILMDQMSEQESRFLAGVSKNKGGLIV